MKTLVISAFPATGKTYTTKKLTNAGWNVIDLDSSEFHWMKDEEGNVIKNPDFVKDYIEVIKRLIGKVDIVFVSTHEEIRKALRENKIEYKIVYPNIKLKEEFVGRCFLRGDSSEFCEKIAENWNKWIENIMQTEKYRSSSYEVGCFYITLEDVLNAIYDELIGKKYKCKNVNWIDIGSYFKS